MLKKLGIISMFTIFSLTCGNLHCWAFDQEDIQIHGFASQGFLYSEGKEFEDDTEDGTWEFNEIGLNLTVPILDKLRFGMQFFMRDLGNMGNNKLVIDWAYVDYAWKDWLGLRAAKIKIPWGLYNKTRDIDSLRVFIFMPESVYYEGLRDFLLSAYGTSLYGSIDAGAVGFFDYEVYSGTSALNETDTITFDDSKMYGGGLYWSTPLAGLKLGGTALSLEADAALTVDTGLVSPLPNSNMLLEEINVNYTGKTELSTMHVLSMQYEYQNFLFAMEYSKTTFETTLNPDSLLSPPINSKTETQGWYASLSWRALSWLELGTYYSKVNIDTAKLQNVPDHYTYRKDVALSSRFNINEYMTFKLESHFVTGLADLTDIPETFSKDKTWEYYAAKISVTF